MHRCVAIKELMAVLNAFDSFRKRKTHASVSHKVGYFSLLAVSLFAHTLVIANQKK
jgi:hypothetical protein